MTTIEIDKKTRLNVRDDHIAVVHPVNKKGKVLWTEYKWFSKMELCLKYLAQKRLSELGTALSLDDYLKEYKNTLRELIVAVGA